MLGYITVYLKSNEDRRDQKVSSRVNTPSGEN